MFDVPDHAQYWSWVTSSRQGLFIPNTMTPEPNAGHLPQPDDVDAGARPGAVRAVVRDAVPVVARRRGGGDGPGAGGRGDAAVADGGAGAGRVLDRAGRRRPRLDPRRREVRLRPGRRAVPARHLHRRAQHLVRPARPIRTCRWRRGSCCIALVGAFRVHTAPERAGRGPRVRSARSGVALLHAYDLVVVYAVVGTFWIVELVRGPGDSVALVVGDRA